MARQIICTVGTSLLTNRDDRPWSGWHPKGDKPLPRLEDVMEWLERADPVKASAETNTLRALEIGEGDFLALLHSDTPEGRFCADALGKFYESICREVTKEKIGKLGYGASVFTTGLKALVDITIKLVRKARDVGRQPVFCATGGFKAEIAFLNIMGALLEIEVFYIHELHRELVKLPRLPITWDAELVSKHKQFFIWIEEEPRKSEEVESWLKSRPELRTLVEDGGDGCTYLSAAGVLLYKVAQERLRTIPRAFWPKADPKPPEKKMNLSKIDHDRPLGWENFVDRLCKIDCVSLVSYKEGLCGGAKVKIIDPEKGIIGVCYERDNKKLPLLVETTAKGENQCELVADYLRSIK